MKGGSEVASIGPAFVLSTGASVIASAVMLRASTFLPKVFVFTVAIGVIGCSKKKEAEIIPVQPAAIAAPAGLVSEITIARPGATWTKLRAAIGGPAMILPSSFGMLASTVFDLPNTTAELFDPEIPALGAVVEEGERFAVVLAFHVKDGPKLAELASTGEDAVYTKRSDAESGVTLLSPKDDEPGPALGISGNYLTIAARDTDLTRFAPFVTRTLPARPVPEEDIVALAPQAGIDHIAKLVRTGWEDWKAQSAVFEALMQTQLGDGAASGPEVDYLATQTEKGVAFLDDLSEARVSLSIKSEFVHFDLKAKPKSGDGAATRALAAMAPGDAKPLLALPAASVLALTYRDTKESRVEAAGDQLALIEKSFTDILPAAEKAKYAESLRAWASSRGDWLSLGVLYANGDTAALVRSAVSDAAGLDRAISESLHRFATVPAFSQILAPILGPYKLSSPSTKPGPKSVRLSRRGGGESIALLPSANFPKEFDLAWDVNENEMVAAMGKDAKSLVAKIPTPSFAESPAIAKLLGSLEGDVGFALLAQPRKIVAELTGKTAPEEAPVLLAVGRNGTKEAWLRVDMSQFALRDLAMMMSGF